MTDLFEPLRFKRGPAMKNHFGLVMTCAAHVQRIGQGFPGQLGVWSDAHLPGLTRLAAKIKAEGALSSVQLHHAGIRSPKDLIGEAPVGPSEDAETGARALSEVEVEQLVEDFVAAAVRSEKAGFDGVEIHGAHGYILCAFLSPETNHRTDKWGGSLENRARIVFEIIKGIRARTRPDFQLGLRLSPERFGLQFADQLEVARWMLASGDLDYLDMSLWDVFKPPVEEAFASKPLLDWFVELPRGETRLGAAGKLMSGADARRVLEHGADFVLLGRAAILHHDFPKKVAADPDFRAIALPVTRAHLQAEGLGPAFVNYMNTWKGFVVQEETEPA